jgi:hypothetical protein
VHPAAAILPMTHATRAAAPRLRALLQARPHIPPGLYLVPAAAFAIWMSLCYAFGSSVPDSDIATQFALVQGISRHGLGFVKTWSYTPDNWLLSLTPLTALAYKLLGTSPQIVIGFGWAIFIATTAFTAGLAYRLAGGRLALIVTAVTIFPSLWDAGYGGFLAFPVTHNISMAWAALTLLLAERAMARPSNLCAAAAIFCIYIDAQSDPWAGAAIALPLAAVTLALAALHWRTRPGRAAALLCAGALVADAAARTRLFGLLAFLPADPITLTTPTGLVNNAGWLFRILPAMFNIIPGSDPDSVLANIFNAFAGFALLVAMAGATLQTLRRASISQQLILGVALLSIAAVTLAFLLVDWGNTLGLIAGRFFVNLYYFGPLIIGFTAFTAWQNLPRLLKIALPGYAALLVLANIASDPGLWTLREPFPQPDDITQLSAFLEQNNLTYGYGGYFEAESLAMNWMTHGRVTIRPVGFYGTEITDHVVESSTLWYQPADWPPGLKKTFLFIGAGGPNCIVMAPCIAMAERQIGPPDSKLDFGPSVVFIYNHPIADKFSH